MIKKNNLYRIKSVLINMCVSSVIAVFMGAVYMSIQYYGWGIILTFLKIALIGMGISVLSELVFCFLDKFVPMNIYYSFLGVFVIIMIGTTLASLIMGVRNITSTIILVIGAELIGISFTYINYRYQTMRLNERLRKKKHNIKEKIL
ncbi:MAG: hypothetical protein ACOC2J_03920 [bacterium]